MVPKRRLELLHLAATASKTVVSTNSTTWAFVFCSKSWCSRWDLNPHTLRHTRLRRTCLPIPPPERSMFSDYRKKHPKSNRFRTKPKNLAIRGIFQKSYPRNRMRVLMGSFPYSLFPAFPGTKRRMMKHTRVAMLTIDTIVP